MAYRSCILIVIDCLRADVLRPYGGEIEFVTGKLWNKAFAPSGWTLPSHASILTGLSPLETGLVTHHDRLQDRAETLAEVFRTAGFRTFAVVNNSNLLKQFGFDRGFDEYVVHLNGPADLDYDRPFIIFQEALSGARGRPYFGFFHTNIVHDYFVDTPWATRDVRVTTANKKHPFSQVNPEEHEELRQRYYHCVQEAVRKIKERILSLIRMDETLVIVTSDHGEGLWPPRFHHGGRLHNDLLHVPLVMMNETGAVDQPFSLVDLKSWILAAMQVRSCEVGEARPIIAYDGAYLYLPDGARWSYKEKKSLKLGALINWPLKTITTSAPGYSQLEAYDLDRDFGESQDLVDSTASSFAQYTRQPVLNQPKKVVHANAAAPVAWEPRGFIDTPEGRQNGRVPINVSGWVLLPGRVIDAIAGIAGSWSSLEYPLDRPDVGLVFPDIAAARLSGFSGSILLPEFNYREGTNSLSVVFRYLDASGVLQSWSMERTIQIR